MLPRRITFPATPPAQLSSFHSDECSLLCFFFPSSPFKISNLRTLLSEQADGVPSVWRRSRSSLRQVLCCLLHTCKASVFMQLRTLSLNGKPIIPVFSICCARFERQRGWGVGSKLGTS